MFKQWSYLISLWLILFTLQATAEFPMPSGMPTPPPPPPPAKCQKGMIYMAASYRPNNFNMSLVSPTQNEFASGSVVGFRFSLSASNIGQQESVMIPRGPVGSAQVTGGSGSVEGSAKCVNGMWRGLNFSTFAMKSFAVNMLSSLPPPQGGSTAGSLTHAIKVVWVPALNPTQNSTQTVGVSANYSGTVYGVSRTYGGVHAFQVIRKYNGELKEHSVNMANNNQGVFTYANATASINSSNPWDIDYSMEVSDPFPGGTWNLPNPGDPIVPIAPTIGGIGSMGSLASSHTINLHRGGGNYCVQGPITLPPGETLDDHTNDTIRNLGGYLGSSLAVGAELTFGYPFNPSISYPFLDYGTPSSWGMCGP